MRGNVEQLPAGFSAKLLDGSISDYTDAIGDTLSLVAPDLDSSMDGTSFNEAYGFKECVCRLEDLTSTCTGNITNVGFLSECSISSLPYDLSPQDSRPFPGKVLSSGVGWNTTMPNVFNFTLMLKNSCKCVGEYCVRQCVCRAAQFSCSIDLFPYSEISPAQSSLPCVIVCGIFFSSPASCIRRLLLAMTIATVTRPPSYRYIVSRQLYDTRSSIGIGQPRLQ